ncbi:DNA methyltransferase [Sphingobium boeckii]|uniref:Methyltransferase n=1 Tax=Sphingobium boeckii TaxID=1082345 RepID=A0A7W9AF73_9SPHN|nr:DNA methyltransferase [Sphingobium boeckii]MBB5684316.1 hypothetical protein [Sphingobium boeckii]
MSVSVDIPAAEHDALAGALAASEGVADQRGQIVQDELRPQLGFHGPDFEPIHDGFSGDRDAQPIIAIGDPERDVASFEDVLRGLDEGPVHYIIANGRQHGSLGAIVIGPATLYLGDAYRIRPQLGWHDADVMDPPYEFRAEGGGHYRESRGGMDQIIAEGLSGGFDHSVINPLICGGVVVFCHNDQLSKLLPYLDGSFKRQAVCIWRKKNPQPVANKHYRPVMEFYIHAWNSGFHPRGALDDLDRQIIAMSPRGVEKFGHATVKPDAVMDKIIRNVAGDSVCDPFMGTGSTGVATVKAGRRFTGIEQNPAHFLTACRRIAASVRAMI